VLSLGCNSIPTKVEEPPAPVVTITTELTEVVEPASELIVSSPNIVFYEAQEAHIGYWPDTGRCFFIITTKKGTIHKTLTTNTCKDLGLDPIHEIEKALGTPQ